MATETEEQEQQFKAVAKEVQQFAENIRNDCIQIQDLTWAGSEASYVSQIFRDLQGNLRSIQQTLDTMKK